MYLKTSTYMYNKKQLYFLHFIIFKHIKRVDYIKTINNYPNLFD